MESLALAPEPVRKAFTPNVETLEQIALIEIRSLRQGMCCGLGRKILEDCDIDLDQVAIESDPIAVSPKPWIIGRRDRLPEHRQGVPQTGPCLLIWAVLPQQSRELVARMTSLRCQRQIGKHRLPGFKLPGQSVAIFRETALAGLFAPDALTSIVGS
jgi:hypothetical protein